MCSSLPGFSHQNKKNEQYTTDNEIKLHETNRKMNSTTRQIIFLFLLLQQNAKQQNAKASINTKAKEERVETEPEIEKENSLKQCREWMKKKEQREVEEFYGFAQLHIVALLSFIIMKVSAIFCEQF